MGLIERSAYLKVCETCKSHAQIIYSDGNMSPHFGSVEVGLEHLQSGFEYGFITEEEAKIVREQLYKSPLPPKRTSGDDLWSSVLGHLDHSIEDSELSPFLVERRSPQDTIINN